MRNGDVIDELVAELAVARLSRDDASDLLTPTDDGPDIAALNARLVELEGRETSIALLIVGVKMKPAAVEPALDELHSELRSVSEQIARTVRRDPLAEAVGREDVRVWWDRLTLARKRVTVETLMDVRIQSVGHGRRVRTTEQTLETIKIVSGRREA